MSNATLSKPANSKPINVAEWKPSIAAACGRVAPLWPLKNFVAVNPLWGMVEKPFPQAVSRLQRVSHSRFHMRGLFYAQAAHDDLITDDELKAASQQVTGGELSLRKSAGAPAREAEEPKDLILTVSDFLDLQDNGKRGENVVNEISKWCAGYFDEGQAAWVSPDQQLPVFEAWKNWAHHYWAAELQGLGSLKQAADSLPTDASAAIAEILSEIGVSPVGAERFLHRQLMSINGWSSYVAQLVREDGLYGKENDALVDLLAIRLTFDLALYRKHQDQIADNPAWLEQLANVDAEDVAWRDGWAVWQEAYEMGFQRKFFSKWKPTLKAKTATSSATSKRPEVQAVFCIDVRSEVFRRAFESVYAGVETIGFAGFFGFTLKHVGFGLDESEGTSRCPVLLTPGLTSHERMSEFNRSDAGAVARLLDVRQNRKVAGKSWKAFQVSPVTSFSFVETFGLGYGVKLLTDGFARPASGPAATADGFSAAEAAAMQPALPGDMSQPADRETLAATAAGALKNMGLTKNFAPIVMICGHGSETENNPYGSSLDCGACGGHAGGTNARVAAQTFNHPQIRELLKSEHGIEIPDDTWFLAAQHNTTTDVVEFYDLGDNHQQVPASHQTALAELTTALEQTARVARTYRAPSLGLGGADGSDQDKAALDQFVVERSQDWSQVRPEWGLAGNALFIAAPRERTKDIPLNGRAFLHNYHPDTDPDKSILELICCAPMVVAHWINMQYYASTVDNDVFGSGNKVTHNVVGTVGILQGNGGDLQVGLPWQSIHDGEKYVHEPLRLNVVIEAATADLDAVIAKHEIVRQLVENKWLHFYSLQPDGDQIQRYLGHGEWGMV